MKENFLSSTLHSVPEGRSLLWNSDLLLCLPVPETLHCEDRTGGEGKQSGSTVSCQLF
ncbi:hypothetical protein MPTK1_2g06760 [Marchantia polymorpha subsp. ruderalis]|uniref:Uncharacterized protein n=1 Tax=Marchantia polymorpha TaxID=3197 RepID=A0A2R6XDU5_MARPO|nr:hypothetical protein MARPO_0021s0129 [Marchantia polymorpha]BBN01349.1 hypothetical protein Mp_2g06760 [Marchantia polymorpha subsp. ruderalis]|eukprot:PTQ44275.1 hypothetical protein MARPO_0021s0129 [Marchantia polymorpha]